MDEEDQLVRHGFIKTGRALVDGSGWVMDALECLGRVCVFVPLFVYASAYVSKPIKDCI
jgi:hypothetical protein